MVSAASPPAISASVVHASGGVKVILLPLLAARASWRAPRRRGLAGRRQPVAARAARFARRSLQEPPGSEDSQDQLVEGDAGVRAEEGDGAARAELRQLLAVLLVLALVGFEQRSRDGDLLRLAGLAV